MKTTLIVNPNAGNTSEGLEEEIQAALQAAGYTCEHRPTQSEEDLEQALETSADLVVAAGGDGTLRAVVKRLAGRGIPLLPLPLGTANNVGNALGLNGSLQDWLGGLERPTHTQYDLGIARGP